MLQFGLYILRSPFPANSFRSPRFHGNSWVLRSITSLLASFSFVCNCCEHATGETQPPRCVCRSVCLRVCVCVCFCHGMICQRNSIDSCRAVDVCFLLGRHRSNLTFCSLSEILVFCFYVKFNHLQQDRSVLQGQSRDTHHLVSYFFL